MQKLQATQNCVILLGLWHPLTGCLLAFFRCLDADQHCYHNQMHHAPK